MKLSRHIITLLVLLAGFAYSVEATLPAINTLVTENTGEETEASEKTESLAPAQAESKRLTHRFSIKIHRSSGVAIRSSFSGNQHFVKPSRVILLRRLLI
jgi:hypothetical protein